MVSPIKDSAKIRTGMLIVSDLFIFISSLWLKQFEWWFLIYFSVVVIPLLPYSVLSLSLYYNFYHGRPKSSLASVFFYTSLFITVAWAAYTVYMGCTLQWGGGH